MKFTLKWFVVALLLTNSLVADTVLIFEPSDEMMPVPDSYGDRVTSSIDVFGNRYAAGSGGTSNVMVEGREEDPLTGFWESVPKQAKPGEKFDIVVNVASGSTCVGKIQFPEGFRWTLGDRTEDDAYCRWRVEVPAQVKTGTAQAEVKIEKQGKWDTLRAEIEIKGEQRPTARVP